jgi:glycerophosphoryl diester phosphodiesterase
MIGAHYRDFVSSRERPCAIVAHRGLWHAAPENSLLAIERAIEAGCDVVQIDVRRAADGEFFLLHDNTLERTASLTLRPETLTLHQLSRLKLRDRDGGAMNHVTSERLPGLKEVFDLVRGRLFVDLDVKDDEMIPDVAACARKMDVADQVGFKADLRTRDDLAWIRDVAGPHDLPFVAQTHLDEPDGETQLEFLFELSPFMSEVSFSNLEQLVERRPSLQGAGIALRVSTLDAVSSVGFTDTIALKAPGSVWGRLIDAGVSAIQTDFPDKLRSFLDGRALRESACETENASTHRRDS